MPSTTYPCGGNAQKMTNEQISVVQRVNEVVRECERFLFVTRCSDLQRNALDAINQESKRISKVKIQAVENNEEVYANVLLGLEYVTGAIASELRMYMALKTEEPDAAWDHLMDAQKALAAASQVNEGFKHCRIRLEKLHVFEKVMFPSQVFLSAGTIVDKLECSICGGNYDECQHLAGLPYMGKLCSTVVTRADLDHIAIVEEPADKRCRVTTFSSDGVERNCMTLREMGQVDDGDAVRVSGVVVRYS